jgi:hypothetical protein
MEIKNLKKIFVIIYFKISFYFFLKINNEIFLIVKKLNK